jgi:hypothetical protein
MRKRKTDLTVKLPSRMSFEDAVRHVLKAGPMPKKPKGKKAKGG